MRVCVSAWKSAHEHRYLQRPEASDPLERECELPDVAAEKQDEGFYERNIYSFSRKG